MRGARHRDNAGNALSLYVRPRGVGGAAGFPDRPRRQARILPHEVSAIGLSCALVIIFPFVKEPVGFIAVLVVAALTARRALAELRLPAVYLLRSYPSTRRRRRFGGFPLRMLYNDAGPGAEPYAATTSPRSSRKTATLARYCRTGT